uniref:Peptidase S1 domain-containing protein n=1 Tax=Equus caballus TaxID=9796 RepID=A0A9L0S1E9_HORSE
MTTPAPRKPIFESFLSEDIIGGQEAKPHSRPYMVFVQCLRGNKKKRCGGVLVQEDFVLTAAHCRGRLINVILGAHNIRKQEKTQQVITVRQAIRHPDYKRKKFSNDIMLLKLEREAKLTAAVRTLSLPWGTAQVRPGELCSVAGWGRVTPNGRGSNTLQEVELTDAGGQEPRSRGSVLPAFSLQGDSGGPLVCENVIQGLVSYGRRDGTPPQAFTKVSSFLPWIKETMKKL